MNNMDLSHLVEPLLNEYAAQYDGLDDFVENYFPDDGDALAWMDAMGSKALLQLISLLMDYYTAMPLEWLDNPQELGNEMVGYLMREVAGVQ